MRKTNIVLFLFFILCTSFLFFACEQRSNNDTTTIEKPQILTVSNQKVTGTNIKLEVGLTKTSLDLDYEIRVSDGAVWHVFDKDNNCYQNRIINLNDGYNTYYVIVSLPDGTYSTKYTLNVFKSYYITVTYTYLEGGFYKPLKTVKVEQSKLFKADYIPELFGYEFVYWHFPTSDKEFTSGTFTNDTKLVAKLTPQIIPITLFVNGEKWKSIDYIYKYNGRNLADYLITIEEKHYTFKGWYSNEECTDYVSDPECYYVSSGNNYYCKLTPKIYNIWYTYNSIDMQNEHRSIPYGTDFEVIESKYMYKYDYNLGKNCIFSGWEYNGMPFESGTYLYDGDIWVNAIWTPIEE